MHTGRCSGKKERNIVVNRAAKTRDKPKQILFEVIVIFVNVLEDTTLNRVEWKKRIQTANLVTNYGNTHMGTTRQIMK